MKAFLFSAFGILGLAVCVGWSGSAPACTEAITSSDVQLVSEQVSTDGQPNARNQHSRKFTRTGYSVR